MRNVINITLYALTTLCIVTAKNAYGEDRPYLFLSEAKIESIKVRISQHKQPYARYAVDLIDNANEYAAEIPYSAADSMILDDYHGFKEIGNRLPVMALAYLLTDSSLYLDGTRRWMDSICVYPQWGGTVYGPSNDLGASHVLFGMSVAFDWLYDEWTVTERQKYWNKIKKHTTILYDCFQNQTMYWHNNYMLNHNHVNVTGIMAGAITLGDDYANRNACIKACYDNFTNVADLLPRDGAFHSSVSYWSFVSQWLSRYFAMEEGYFGEDRLTDNPWFMNTGLFRLHASVPGFTDVLMYGDGITFDWYGPTFVLEYLTSKYRDPQLQWLSSRITNVRMNHNHWLKFGWENLIWYDETVPTAAGAPNERAKYFSDLGLYVSRSSWEDDAVYFATKSGPVFGHAADNKLNYNAGAGHVHPDAGAFVLYCGNNQLIRDDGYSYLKRTASHNVVTVNGIGQLGEGAIWYDWDAMHAAEGQASISFADTGTGYEYVVCDLGGIYRAEAGISEFRRHFVFINKEMLYVFDDIKLKHKADVEFRLHMPLDADVSLEGDVLTCYNTERTVGFTAHVVPSQDSTWAQLSEYVVKDSNALGDNSALYESRLYKRTIRAAGNVRLETVILPFKGVPGNVTVDSVQGKLKISYSGKSLLIDTDNKSVEFQPAVNLTDRNAIERSLSRVKVTNRGISIRLINLPANVKIHVYDTAGNTISLLNAGLLEVGVHKFDFEGYFEKRDSGIQFVQVSVNGTESVYKLIRTSE